MAIKSDKMVKLLGAMQPNFCVDLPENGIYDSWNELLENYKIDGIPVKDVLCSDEVDIY
jgi:hypothetical protein